MLNEKGRRRKIKHESNLEANAQALATSPAGALRPVKLGKSFDLSVPWFLAPESEGTAHSCLSTRAYLCYLNTEWLNVVINSYYP